MENKIVLNNMEYYWDFTTLNGEKSLYIRKLNK